MTRAVAGQGSGVVVGLARGEEIDAVQLSVGARRPISAAGARLLWRSLSSKKIQKLTCKVLLFAVYRRHKSRTTRAAPV